MRKTRKEFQKLLFSSLCHEQMSPLNNICSMGELAIGKVNQAI